MFDATQSKFRDVNFQKLNIDEAENKELMGKYGVQGIPATVFLDNGGAVLFAGHPSRDEESFARQISQYH